MKTKKTSTEKWTDSKQKKLKLAKNTKYKITVTPIPTSDWADYNLKMQARQITKNPTWSVYKTKGVKSCQ